MGQAIVYCSNCSAQIRGADFEARRAFKVEEQVFCAKCCREVLGSLPEAPLTASSTKLKAHAASSSSRTPSSTSRIKIEHLAPPPTPPPKSGSMVGVAAIVGVVAIVIVIAVVASGGGDRRQPSLPAPATPAIASPSAPIPRASAKEVAAQETLAKAIRFAADHPQDLVAQRTIFTEAVARAGGTTLLEDARRELDRVDRKLRDLRDSEFARHEASARGKPEEALALWRKARAQFDDPSWIEAVDRKISDLESVAPTPAPAPAPVAAPVEPKPAPAPVAVDPRRPQWEAALLPSVSRDYAAAISALEKLGASAPDAARDLQLLRSVTALHQEALNALARTPKGQKLALEFRDGSGSVRKVEASFAGDEDGRVELRSDSGSVEVETGEILPASLADLVKNRGGAVDPVAAAVFCLLEGDEENARRFVGGKTVAIPSRYWSYARKVAASGAALDPARALYQEAMSLANNFATAADAVPKLQALLRDHAESSFVRRNKASLAARVQQVARDYIFFASDLKPSGTFKAAKSAKGNACWTSDADTDPAKPKENFLELAYSVLADTPYKCWIYAGGCCLETFEFSVQGTEMIATTKGGKEKEAAEPGSAAASVIKPWISSLKKTHASHVGPKQPSHWEWVAIPLPKYSKPGLERLRILTDQKGFSVAVACVTATRGGPPKEIDLKDLEKARGDRPAPVAAQGPKAIILYSCAFDGADRGLVGDLRDKALFGTNLYSSCFLGVERNPVFTMPAQGELRITYFLNSATPLTARFRVRRGEQSVPYDAVVPQPVAGRPTELRIPFSEFKMSFGSPVPPPAPGDVVPMVYIFGQDVNCGLRIDALSIVELRSDPAGKAAATSSGKILFSENFDAGPGKFAEGEWVDGGVNGSKAYAFACKGASAWNPCSIPARDTVTISFKLKPLGRVPQAMVMVWSDKYQDNARFLVDGLREGQWNEVRFKATQLRLGAAGDGPSVDLLCNFKIFLLGSAPEIKVLLDDFEIRE